MNNAERERAQDHNRQAWDRLVENKNRFTRPAKDEDLVDPLSTVDAIGWLGGDIRGLKLLCLAAGGGKHGVIYAEAGADVTVVDLSPAMLELDRLVAAERGLDLRTVETSMDNLEMFGDGDFDLLVKTIKIKFNTDSEIYGVPGLTASSLIAEATSFKPINDELLLG